MSYIPMGGYKLYQTKATSEEMGIIGDGLTAEAVAKQLISKKTDAAFNSHQKALKALDNDIFKRTSFLLMWRKFI